jgi:hypothetical protein
MAHDYDDEVQTPDAPISMNKEWRPADWVNPHDNWNPDHVDNVYVEQAMFGAFETGASAMLAALIKWLFEPCTEHPLPSPICTVNSVPVIYPVKYSVYHYLCPKCMESLKKMEAKDVAI